MKLLTTRTQAIKLMAEGRKVQVCYRRKNVLSECHDVDTVEELEAALNARYRGFAVIFVECGK